MNKKINLSAISFACIMLIGCSQQKSENKKIISGISLGMTKEEVFEIYGDNYIYNEERYNDKNTVEYGYSLDRLDIFDVDMKTQVFFEFENDETLVCYGYHIGRTGDYYDSTYPYPEKELTESYDKICKILTEWYGTSISNTENYADDGVLNENSWKNEEGSVWFVVGINMWAITEPVSYEKGVNEILLSCAVSE